MHFGIYAIGDRYIWGTYWNLIQFKKMVKGILSTNRKAATDNQKTTSIWTETLTHIFPEFYTGPFVNLVSAQDDGR